MNAHFTKPRLTPAMMIANITPVDWAWMNVKSALLLFGVSILFFTPSGAKVTLAHITILVWAWSTIIGAVICILGMIGTRQPHEGMRKYGAVTELIGLILLAVGPVIYFIIQTYIVFTHGPMWEQRVTIMCFAYAFVGVIVARFLIVWMHYRTQIADMKRKHPRRK